MTATTTPSPGPTQTAECVEASLTIGGMTCASCVKRVEKTLTRVDGVVAASVNLANETATVSYDPAFTSLEGLTAAVARSGYTAAARTTTSASGTGQETRVPAIDSTVAGGAEPNPVDELDARRDSEIAHLKRRWQVALTTGLTLMAVMYVPIYLDTMDWLMPLIFVVATAVQFWAGAGIYRAAWARAKHRTTNMNTLVALGTGVAYGYSTFVTLWPGLAERWGLPLHVYFETALIDHRAGADGPLAGAAGPAAHRRRHQGAGRARPQDRPRAPRRRRGRRAAGRGAQPATASGSAPARRSPSTASSSTAPRPSTSRC